MNLEKLDNYLFDCIKDACECSEISCGETRAEQLKIFLDDFNQDMSCQHYIERYPDETDRLAYFISWNPQTFSCCMFNDQILEKLQSFGIKYKGNNIGWFWFKLLASRCLALSEVYLHWSFPEE